MTAQRTNRKRTGGDRLRTLQTALLAGSVAQTFRYWFSVNEFVEEFQRDVGELNRRTAMRYLQALEHAGVLESMPRRSRVDDWQYRWIGWPASKREAG